MEVTQIMGTTYVAVPSEDIIHFLQAKGFTPVDLTGPSGRPLNEVVYERAHKDNSAVKVRVYTSIAKGHTVARRRAKDSIKVCTVVVGRNRTFGVGKFPRVHRTGSPEKVLSRMLQRMRAAYARGTEWLREQILKDVMDT
jgi:hypothetical protein